MAYSVQFGVGATYTPVITSNNVEDTKDSSKPIGPLPLPPPPQPFSLNALRGRLSSTNDDPISLKEVPTDGPGLAFDLGIQPDDPGHAPFYNAVTDYTMRHCKAVHYCDKYRRMRIEARDRSSLDQIGRAADAVDEVRTLVHFIQRIGGDLGLICMLLRDKDQTQTIKDLHSVFGGNPEQPTIKPDAVLRLSNACALRPDVQLALLDHALPQCLPGPDKSRLADQWIGFAAEATDEFEGPPLFLQQAVIAALLTNPHLELDPKSRSMLVALAHRSVIGKSDTEDHSSLVGSQTSWREATDAMSTLTPGERLGINRRTKLMLLCESGDFGNMVEEVERCMESGAPIDARDDLGGTALKLASENGHLEIVQYLLEMGADVNAKDNRGRTPLDWALANRHAEVVKALGGWHAPLGNLKWVVRRDETESRAADTALSSPRFSAKTIIVRSKSVGRTTVDDLVKACRSDKLDAVQKCIAHRVAINAKDQWGRGRCITPAVTETIRRSSSCWSVEAPNAKQRTRAATRRLWWRAIRERTSWSKPC
jgi:hypothetical protein